MSYYPENVSEIVDSDLLFYSQAAVQEGRRLYGSRLGYSWNKTKAGRALDRIMDEVNRRGLRDQHNSNVGD